MVRNNSPDNKHVIPLEWYEQDDNLPEHLDDVSTYVTPRGNASGDDAGNSFDFNDEENPAPMTCTAMPATVIDVEEKSYNSDKNVPTITVATLGLCVPNCKRREFPELTADCADLRRSLDPSGDPRSDWFVKKIDWTDQTHLSCMKKHLLENQDQLDPDQEFLFVNCLNMGDPNHDKTLRDHKGTHPQTLIGLSRDSSDADVEHYVSHTMHFIEDKAKVCDLCVVFVCKRECHRSVGCAWLYSSLIKENAKHWIDRHFDLVVLPGRGNFKHKCSKYCEFCTHKNLEKDGSRELVNEAKRLYQERFKRLTISSSKKPYDKRASKSCILGEAAGKPARQAYVAKRDHGRRSLQKKTLENESGRMLRRNRPEQTLTQTN